MNILEDYLSHTQEEGSTFWAGGQGLGATFFGSLVGWAPGDHRPGRTRWPFQARFGQTLAFFSGYLAHQARQTTSHRLRGWVWLGAGEGETVSSFYGTLFRKSTGIKCWRERTPHFQLPRISVGRVMGWAGHRRLL